MTTRRNLFAVLSIAVQAAILISGLTGHEHMWNLYRFFAWCFPMYYFVLVSMKVKGEPIEGLYSVGYPKVGYVAAFTDMGSMCLLAAFGHFGYATLKLLELLLEQFLFLPDKTNATNTVPASEVGSGSADTSAK